MNQRPLRHAPVPKRLPGQTRARILDAARDLFAEQGYRSTSMRQVAARAGLTDPALYYHFASKQDVLSALMPGPDDDSAGIEVDSIEGLIDHVCRLFQEYSDDAPLLRILLRGQLDHEVDSVTFRARRVELLRHAIAPPLERIYGPAAAATLQGIEYLLFGMLWDGIIAYGREWPVVARQELFQARARRLVSLVLGASPGDEETTR